MRLSIIVIALLLVTTYNQQCEVDEGSRTDCGYMGINQQQCEAKGCCWKPTRLT